MDKIRVMIVEPGKDPRLETIDNDIHVMQQIVGGYVEALRMKVENLYILCHEEGRFQRLPLNRIGVYGTFLVVGVREPEFVGLTGPQIKNLMALFRATAPISPPRVNTCVVCGVVIPDGRQTCGICWGKAMGTER